MKLDRWTRPVVVTLAVLATLLAGCTSYVTTQVTAFSDWNGGSDATRTYAFQRTGAQQTSLEQSTYEQVVANALATHAFTLVDPSQAHYLVAIAYGTRSDMAMVSQPSYYYDPWVGPYAWGRPYGWGGWGPYGPWGPYGGGYVTQSYPVYTQTLGIRITDRVSSKEVYNVTARSAGDDSSLVHAMPFLARSAMADFPLGNGVVRTVRIPLDNTGSGGAPNEVAAGGAAPAMPASGAKTVQ
jgi:Domain of unknown function (DUF4136)